MDSEFEWDEQKRALIFQERGIDLVRAARMFRGNVLRTEDLRNDYGEVRWRAVGQVGEEVWVLIFTERGSHVRLITAWKAGRKDRDDYQARFP